MSSGGQTTSKAGTIHTATLRTSQPRAWGHRRAWALPAGRSAGCSAGRGSPERLLVLLDEDSRVFGGQRVGDRGSRTAQSRLRWRVAGCRSAHTGEVWLHGPGQERAPSKDHRSQRPHGPGVPLVPSSHERALNTRAEHQRVLPGGALAQGRGSVGRILKMSWGEASKRGKLVPQ